MSSCVRCSRRLPPNPGPQQLCTRCTKRAAEQLDTLAATTQVLRMKEGDSSSPAPLPAFAAVRADVSELPFADASVAAAHSSAALAPSAQKEPPGHSTHALAP